MEHLEVARILDVMQAIVNVRQFKPDPVPADLEAKLLEALRLGPSTANTQPWELVEIRSDEKRQAVAQATLDPLMRPVAGGGQRWITSAPLLWLLAIDRKRAEARLGAEGFTHAAEDCFAAVQNLRVLAGCLGLATAAVREIDRQAVAKVLDLPWWVEPLCLVAAGWSDATRELPPRMAPEQFLHREGW